MKINKKTMLFSGLTAQECEELKTLAESIVLRGRIPAQDENPWVEAWLKGCFDDDHFDEDHQLQLVISRVFPARALLSVINEMKRLNTTGRPPRPSTGVRHRSSRNSAG